MEDEKLIKKWLSNELTAQEQQEFSRTHAYKEVQRISEAAKYFKAPQFNVEENLVQLEQKLDQKRSHSWKSLLKIAAVFVAIISISYFTFFQNEKITVTSAIASTKTIVLPDNSEVILNADSYLAYDEDNWYQNRTLSLRGEAFFKVEKGESFEVETPMGKVLVLGTQFNVKQRDDFFEVVCFEGKVEVKSRNHTAILTKGESFRSLNAYAEEFPITVKKEPTWIKGLHKFQNVPYPHVLEELERQYGVTITLHNFDAKAAGNFTGAFANNDLKSALQSVTIPFNLNFKIENKKVSLMPRE